MYRLRPGVRSCCIVILTTWQSLLFDVFPEVQDFMGREESYNVGTSVERMTLEVRSQAVVCVPALISMYDVYPDRGREPGRLDFLPPPREGSVGARGWTNAAIHRCHTSCWKPGRSGELAASR